MPSFRPPHSRHNRSGASQHACIEPMEPRTMLSESASAQLHVLSTTGAGTSTVYNYDITVTDTGATNVGTFWFGWVPGEDFLPTRPSGIASPTGWNDTITGANTSADGSAIQWVAGSTSADITPGQSLAGFNFSSKDSPSQLSANSPTHPAEPATTSFVYAAAPLSDPGFQLTVAIDASIPAPNPTSTTTTLVASTPAATVGQAVTFTATIAPTTAGGATPTGTVTFASDGVTIGTASLSAAVASFTTTALPAGAHSITAAYAGDSANAASASSALLETITAAGPAESASAQLQLLSLSGTPAAPVYNYNLILTDTGSTPIGTFWYAWTPGENFLPTRPISEASPAGWGNAAGTLPLPDVTGPQVMPDGTALRWVAQSSAADLTPGQSLGGFQFSSTDNPATLAGLSPTHTTTPVGTSFIYAGAPFSDAGAQFTAAPVPNPSDPHLQPSLDPAKTPTAGIAGQSFNHSVPITVTNFQDKLSKSVTTTTLFAVPQGVPDTSEIAIASVKRRLQIRAGAQATVSLQLRKLPPSLPAGTYSLVAAVTDPANTTLLSTTPATLVVAAPTIVLSANLIATPLVVAQSRFLSLSVTVSNTGNIDSTGVVVFSPTLTATGAAASPLAPIRRVTTIRPGANPTVFHFRVPVPTAFAAGESALALTLRQGGVFITATGDTSITLADVTVGPRPGARAMPYH